MIDGAFAWNGVTAMLMTLRLWIIAKQAGENDNEAVKTARSNPSRRDPPGGLYETAWGQHQSVSSRSGCTAKSYLWDCEWYPRDHGRYGVEAGHLFSCFAGNLAWAATRL